jgi:hypothetical protein
MLCTTTRCHDQDKIRLHTSNLGNGPFNVSESNSTVDKIIEDKGYMDWAMDITSLFAAKCKMASIICICLLNSDYSFSQAIPPEYKKPVVFIFIKDENDKIVPSGTGFFVEMPDSINNISFNYLITAKHVIQKPRTNIFYDSIFVRINKRQSGFDTIPLQLIAQNGFENFVMDQDQGIDIAVIPLAPDFRKYDYLGYPESMLFASKEELDSSYLKEGTNIFYTGLFSPYLGYNSNNPIVRFGRLALLPHEKIFWDSSSVKQELFLVETTTYGGNSGSPLFCYYIAQNIGGGLTVVPKPVKLAGIIKGYSGEKTPVEYVESGMNLTYTSNVGITAVIPSYLLYSILEGDVLKTTREQILKQLKK